MFGALVRMSLAVLVAVTAAAAQEHTSTVSSDSVRAESPQHLKALPPAPPVEELVREALARAPEIAAARARIDAARAAVAPAGAMPNPMLAALYQNGSGQTHFGGVEDMSMIGVELMQPLPFPGKRAARRRAAGFETAIRLHEHVAAQRDAALAVRTSYAHLYRLDRTAAELEVARELVDLLAATAAARYSTGEVAMGAQIKAQLEEIRLAARLDDLHAERNTTLARLNRILLRSQGQEIGRVMLLPDVAPPAGSWADRAVRFAPEVAARHAAIAAAEGRLEVAQRDDRPDFVAGIGVMARRDGDPIYMVRLGAELPIWTRPGRMAPAAAADLLAVRAESQQAERDARAAVERLAAEWKRADLQVRRTRDAILPQTSAAFDAVRSAYVAGHGEFTPVIDDFRVWLEARIELAEREAERFIAWAELEALIAAPDTPAPGGSR